MYRARLVKESPEFHHGKPFKATIKLEYHDGSPASNVKCSVEAAGTKEGNFERVSDVKGEIPLQLTASESYDELILTVRAGEQEILEENINKATSDNEALLEVTIKNKVLINKPIKIKIRSHHQIQFVIYYVLAKGNVVDQGFLRVNRKPILSIDIKYQANMVPKATVFVATVVGNTVIYDLKDIVFRDLSNNFEMEIENESVKPGEHIELKMMGRPGSYVALAGYDKRLLQHGSTHDVYWKDVMDLYNAFYANEENEFDIFQVTYITPRLKHTIIFYHLL